MAKTPGRTARSTGKTTLTEGDLKLLRKEFVTKEDAKAFATKADMHAIEQRDRMRFDSAMDAIGQSFQEVNDKLDRMAINTDRVLGIATAALQEVRMHAGGKTAHNEIEHRVELLDKRVTALETKRA